MVEELLTLDLLDTVNFQQEFEHEIDIDEVFAVILDLLL